MRRIAIPVWTLLLLSADAPRAWAESYCIACYGPESIYRCVIAGEPETAPPDPRNQVQCVKQIAKAGGHSRCSVERFSTSGCNGPERIVSKDEAVPLQPVEDAAQGETPVGAPAVEEGGPDVSPSSEPPRTVEELAKTTAQKTKKGLEDVGSTVKTTTEKAGETIGGVGSAVGDAAKKTWNCLTSLFGDC